MFGRGLLIGGFGWCLAAASPVMAKAQTSSIVGVVADAANHVLPGVTVTLAGVDSD
jgi:hypothetical protein